MPHFLIQKNNLKGNRIEIEEPSLIKHFNALRILEGEKIKLLDEFETQYLCEVVKINKKEMICNVLESYKSERKLNFELFLAQVILKTDAQNLAIDNAVQLGVKGIYPILGDNCTIREDIAREKVEKWRKIAKESVKQCERADIPQIFDVQKLEDVLSQFENVIIFGEKNNNISLKNCLNKLDKTKKILVVIGPEGGFSKREFEWFKNKNYMIPTLGKLILKAPNAISAGLSNVIWGLSDE